MADIAQLLDEWVASPVTTKAGIRGMKSAMRAAAARIRELEQDAARYRWLRSDDIEVLPGQHEISVVKHRLPFTEDSDETLTESELDAAIDAARGGEHG